MKSCLEGEETKLSIVISHSSAFLFWRRFSGSVSSFRASELPRVSRHSKLTPSILAELAAREICPSVNIPLHCLVSDAASRPRVKGVVAHYTKQSLTAGAILRLSPQVSIVSPELCFLQMAKALPPAQLALMAFELCGSYAIRGSDLLQRKPLTTPEKLRAFVTVYPGIPGVEKAVWALNHVVANAASPMEAKTVLLLCMPMSAGGYGLPHPELNPTIPLSMPSRALYRVKTYRPDLYWPKIKLDVEYDGDSHEEETSHAKDTARILALKAEGVEVVVLTYSQVVNADAFDAVAKLIASKLHHRLRFRMKDFSRRRTGLRKALNLQNNLYEI